ncbi:MAG: M20/M25/M40 family metallo-hydrolase [Elusimicrobia bacterium]|nr:M20/M25/M40 family metallo-hydrolase [Elusimicrobiota bacterium]
MEPDLQLAERLERHVRVLSHVIGERSLGEYGNLVKAKDYVFSEFRSYGYEPSVQEYRAYGRTFQNLTAEKPGRTPEVVLVGAHYDSVAGTPGADDNASGVAALLELARAFAGTPRERTLRFAAFSTEEPPFFRTSDMGSAQYAKLCRKRKDNIKAMVCLEAIGFYSDLKGSQTYPPLVHLFYPEAGNFAAVVGDLLSGPLVRRVAEGISGGSSMPVQKAALPRLVPGIDFSDHANFWKEGYPAVMVTDTAFYRNKNYHTAEDTYEKLDYVRMAELTRGLAASLSALAG